VSDFFKQLAIKQATKFERQTKNREKFEKEMEQIIRKSGNTITRQQALNIWLNCNKEQKNG